jgi:ketosteroid isomerase-like protein
MITASTLAQTKEETEVAAAVEALRKAMIDADKNTLEKIISTHLSYGHSGGKIEDKASFIDALTNGSSDFVTILLSDQTIKISDNTAIVRHRLDAETNDKGSSNTVHLSILLVWQKQKGQWNLLARQAVKLP